MFPTPAIVVRSHENQLEEDRFIVLIGNDTFHSVNTNHVRHARISIFVENDKNKICLYGPYTAPVKSWGGSEDIEAIFDHPSASRQRKSR